MAARGVVLFGVSVLMGCSIAGIPGDGTYRQDSTTAAACIAEPSTFEKVDRSTLATCECRAGGKAHCVAAAELPSALAAPLETCEGTSGRCVPDALLEDPTRARFPKCRTSGDEGRCVSLCVPKVAKYAETLTRGDGDTCSSDERCVPCAMPDGSSSGICEVGSGALCGESRAVADKPMGELACPYDGKKMNVSQMPVCAAGGRCISEAFLEEVIVDANTRTELRARLERCAIGYCMPEEYLEHYGQYKPPACTSFAGIEGRCFSTVFKDVAAQAALLPQGTCGERDRCIPCYNPADGTPSGACTTVRCDGPTKAPTALADCCEQGGKRRGKCVPRGDVPEQFRSRLEPYECDESAELCMPAENVDLKSEPAPCVAKGIFGPAGEGVCVSRCLHFSFLELVVSERGDCREDQTCAPCFHPQTGEPTRVPGCKYAPP